MRQMWKVDRAARLRFAKPTMRVIAGGFDSYTFRHALTVCG
jgi:hypothetical protein